MHAVRSTPCVKTQIYLDYASPLRSCETDHEGSAMFSSVSTEGGGMRFEKSRRGKLYIYGVDRAGLRQLHKENKSGITVLIKSLSLSTQVVHVSHRQVVSSSIPFSKPTFEIISQASTRTAFNHAFLKITRATGLHLPLSPRIRLPRRTQDDPPLQRSLFLQTQPPFELRVLPRRRRLL